MDTETSNSEGQKKTWSSQKKTLTCNIITVLNYGHRHTESTMLVNCKRQKSTEEETHRTNRKTKVKR